MCKVLILLNIIKYKNIEYIRKKKLNINENRLKSKKINNIAINRSLKAVKN